ncbi:MAG TPA: DUF4214 domain-containing protein [Acidimicrobiales bacterium]|nr:DUF4214 domain-containing protein [Acidimicrobiales bacterium]
MTTTTPRWKRALVALVATTTIALPGAVAGAQEAPPTGPNPFTQVAAYLRTSDVNTQGTIGAPMSSPAIGDVTGDGVADVVVGSLDGTLTVLDPRTGTVLRQLVVQSGSMVQTAPTLVDVTGDGVLDVAVGTVRNVKGVPGSSRIKIYDLTAATARTVFDQGDSGLANLSGFFGAPAVGDVDGDGVAEVVALGLDHRLHAWELTGALIPGFPTYTYDTSLSSPALADVDRDGAKEIVFGGDMDSVGQPLPPGGYLWVVDGKGDPMPGYPLRLGGEVIWSSPAVADVDGDGDLDAVVGTGRNFGHGDQRLLSAIDLQSRQQLLGWPRVLTGNTMASPALAQLDDDAAYEVITLTGEGRAHRREHTGRGTWETCVMPAAEGCNGDLSFIASPVVADADGDGTLEVVVTANREVVVLDAATGAIEQRLPMQPTPEDFAWPGANAPAIAVVEGATYVAAFVQLDNGDQRWDHGDRQAIYVWRAPAPPTTTSASASTTSTAPWPHFRRDAARTGTIDPHAPVPTPSEPIDSDYSGISAYVDAVHRDLLGRASRFTERYEWGRRIREGLPRGEFTLALSRSPEWTGRVVDGLYDQIFGRAPDAGGRTYWSQLISQGLRVSEVASHFYGSDEWFASPAPTGGGGTVGGFVDALYGRILRRDPDAARSYWVGEVRAGVPRVTVAKAFYLSLESNVRRVDVLYRTLLDRRADEGGRQYWGRQLVEVDDIRLAGLLTASDEYFENNRG